MLLFSEALQAGLSFGDQAGASPLTRGRALSHPCTRHARAAQTASFGGNAFVAVPRARRRRATIGSAQVPSAAHPGVWRGAEGQRDELVGPSCYSGVSVRLLLDSLPRTVYPCVSRRPTPNSACARHRPLRVRRRECGSAAAGFHPVCLLAKATQRRRDVRVRAELPKAHECCGPRITRRLVLASLGIEVAEL